MTPDRFDYICKHVRYAALSDFDKKFMWSIKHIYKKYGGLTHNQELHLEHIYLLNHNPITYDK